MQSLIDFLKENTRAENDPKSSHYFMIGLLNVLRFAQVLLENPQDVVAREQLEAALSKLGFEDWPPIPADYNADVYKQPTYSVCMKNGEVFLV